MINQRITDLIKTLSSSTNLDYSKLRIGFKSSQGVTFYDFKGNIDKKFEWLNNLVVPGVTTIIYAESSNSQQIIQTENSLKAFLDDMAQLLGPALQITNKNLSDVEKALANNSTCLFQDGGYIVTGRNDNEVGLAVILLEKACRIKILANELGGVKYLEPDLAQFDHQNYLEHYSHAQCEGDK